VVEAQHKNSTRKLVDSDDEQLLLEQLIDAAKPPIPPTVQEARLHYLLYTPFRHPPLRNGSRFGTRQEMGIFYGAREIETAVAEVAYYRLLFLEGSRAELGLVQTEHTAFRVGIRTERGVDLTLEPFARFMAEISSKTSYTASQPLGTQMRAEGVQAFLYASARAEHGTNAGLFSPVFETRSPDPKIRGWACTTTLARVEFRETNTLQPRQLAFRREDFTVGGHLPHPAL
jgi:hypothetical protein